MISTVSKPSNPCPGKSPCGDANFDTIPDKALTWKSIAHVMFCIHARHMVLLHGFIKKTQQTPDSDLDLAMKRKKEIER